ncbi:MAG: TraM recognition domain-containing protein [Solirubrobacteraceae bacterium]
MAAQTDRHARGPGAGYSPLAALLAALLAATVFEGALQAGSRLAHTTHPSAPVNPLAAAIDLANGKIAWPTQASIVLAGELLLVAALVGVIAWVRSRPGRSSRATHVDRAARLMGTGKRITPVTLANAKATAARYGVEQPGLPLGVTVAGAQPLYGTWEDMQCDIWGPRKGKTTARAIPTLLAAPGPAVATSNKPDLYAATAGLRAARGRLWNFDPQQLTGISTPGWWWNPLSYITADPRRSDARSLELADAFVAADRDPTAHTDAYFDPAGKQLAAYLLLAAALDDRPVTQAFLWSTTPNDEEPVKILHEHGLHAAQSLLGYINAPAEQRGGVWSVAERALSFLRDPSISEWITDPLGRRPQLDLDALVTSTDTLYLHSKEGPGSAAGLVTALAMALCDAGERRAVRSPHGRLQTPLVGVLDEAANICRWPALPNLYSHYGSRGIPLLTLLQSWQQGATVWGEAGMAKLWGASNIRVYGGGVSDEKFLAMLEKLIGEYNRPVRQHSSSSHKSGDSRSFSVQLTPTPILTVADLAALPRGRTVILPSGSPPILARPVPWWETPNRDAIQTSEREHDPAITYAPAGASQDRPANPWLTTH